MEKDIKENDTVVLYAKDIAEIMGVSTQKVYEIMRTPGFPLLNIGRTKKVLKKSFFEWLNQQEQKKA